MIPQASPVIGISYCLIIVRVGGKVDQSGETVQYTGTIEGAVASPTRTTFTIGSPTRSTFTGSDAASRRGTFQMNPVKVSIFKEVRRENGQDSDGEKSFVDTMV